MSITLKAWEQAKSAEVVSRSNEPFPAGRNIETKVTELSCRFKDNDPEKPSFIMKLETNDDKKLKGVKFFDCFDDSGVSQTGKEWRNDGDEVTGRLVADIKNMGYDLSAGDGVTIEEVIKAISDDQPIVKVDCVAKNNYRNIYINKFVRYSQEVLAETEVEVSSHETVSEDKSAEQEQESPEDFRPNAGMLVEAKPKSCRKVEEYKVIMIDSDEDTCTLRRMRDKQVFEDVEMHRVFNEVE